MPIRHYSSNHSARGRIEAAQLMDGDIPLTNATKLAASKNSLCVSQKLRNNSPKSNLFHTLITGTAIGIFSLANTVSAQSNIVERAELGLDEIIVTATKRAQNIQDVPISITAFTAPKLESLNADGLIELGTYVPNMWLPASTEAGQQYITMRGISAGVTKHTGRSVGVYADGVYVNADTALNLPMSGVKSVEVLKGPQGTLFGRDTIGGAINITTSAPSDELTGRAEFEIGNYGRTQGRLSVDVPVVKDTLSIRLSADKLDTDGYIENQLTGNMAGAVDHLGLGAQVFYQPTDQFQARLVYQYRDLDDRPNTMGETVTGLGADTVPYTINLDQDERQTQTAHSLSLNMAYELGNGFTVRSVTGFNDVEDFYIQDGDRLPEAITIAQFNSNYSEFSQEFRLESPQDQALTYLVGAYYLNAKSDYSPTFPLMHTAFLEVLEQDVFGVPAGPRPDDILDGQLVSEKVESFALFGHADYALTERLNLFAGLRYTDDKKTLDYSIFGESFAYFYQLYYAQMPSGVNTSKLSANPVSWTVGGRYALNDQINTYASVSRGYRSGSVKDDFITQSEINAGEGFYTEPEFVTNYEAGVKALLWDNRVRANFSAFYMDYTDIQVSISDPRFPYFRLLANAASAHITGFEADIEAQITSGLTVSGAIGHVKTQYDNFKPSDSVDLSGTGFGSSPNWTYSAAVDYTAPLTADLLANLHVDYTDRSVPSDFAPQSHPLAFVGDYGVTNLSIGIEADRWDAKLWVKNVFDVNDPAVNFVWGRGLGSRIENETVSYEPPRTVGVTLGYRFGAE